MSEYDPIVPRRELSNERSDLDQVRALFERSAARFLRSPWSWVLWAVIVAAASFSTRSAAAIGGAWTVVILWSTAILVGGVAEALLYARGGRDLRPSQLARWVLSSQGNLSIVGLALSCYLVWAGHGLALPGVWLLVLGHSFWAHGGLGFPAFRTAGALYQLGGLAALTPWVDPLVALAVAFAAGNLWLAVAVWRHQAAGDG